MFCPNCGQETEQGKFCTKCGAKLANEEFAAAADPTIGGTVPTETPLQENSVNEEASNPNQSVENVKAAGSAFGQFFVKLVKRPSTAQSVDGNAMISGIIAIVLYSLVISLGFFLLIRSAFGSYGPSFAESFLLPFLEFAILFGAVALLTFAGSKLCAQAVTVKDVIAKYGAYLVPFMLLFIIGFLLALVNLTSFGILAIMVSILGPIIAVPTMILFEKNAVGIDRIFILIGVYLVSILVFSLLLRSFLGSIMDALLGGFMGGFGF
ncbi:MULTISPECIES: zinc ribbon domain-containing protein [unclassified Virgibacillus]|uniref:zinc ribbon domain-containing protein n=1 Tax=unclassified Virgibacillus TaxID=2620237 RepID=UPI0024DE49FB|nr:zinc ribbon domain-containing protein [Virgibacillus sp. LDC-1]